jgi:hypothetical protein
MDGMKKMKLLCVYIAITLVALPIVVQASGGVSEQISRLKVQPPSSEMNLDPFYKKSLDLDGFAIVGSEKVDDVAFKEVAYVIKAMLQNRPDVLEKLAERQAHFIIVGHTEFVTQMPEYRDFKPAKYWDRRTRGFGPSVDLPVVSCGEENVLRFPGDPYRQESILVHEFGHAIMDGALVYIEPEFKPKLQAAYDAAKAKGLWKKYAGSNIHEYWAEGVQSYFDDNRPPDHDHNHVNTRVELFEYDPVLANLIKDELGDLVWRYKKPSDRDGQDNLHLAGYDASSCPKFAWPAELIEWYGAYQKEQARKKDQG